MRDCERFLNIAGSDPVLLQPRLVFTPSRLSTLDAHDDVSLVGVSPRRFHFDLKDNFCPNLYGAGFP